VEGDTAPGVHHDDGDHRQRGVAEPGEPGRDHASVNEEPVDHAERRVEDPHPGDRREHRRNDERQEPGARLRALAVHRSDGALDDRLDVDPRPDVQRGQLAPRSRRRDHVRVLLARQRLAGDGLHHRGEHLARCPLLRHHAPRRAPDDLARPPRGRRHRRRERSAALRLRDVAYPQARRDHRDHVLRDLHLLGLPARLRADERRARERDEHLRHLRLQPGHARRSARAGRRRGALDAAGARPPDRRADALPEARLMVGGRGLGLRTRRLYLPLGFFLVATLFPFYWMFVTSIKPNRELYNAKIMPLVVHQPTLQHYVDLLSQTNFLTWTYNTMLVAVVTTLVSLVLGAMIGYPLARLRFPGAAVVAIGVAATYLVPQPLLFIPMSDV